MAVTLATIRASSYTTMFNHLQTGTYALSTNNIHPSYNDNQLKTEGFPQIIILPPIVSQVKLTLSESQSIKEADVNYTIETYHSSAESAQAIADEVSNNINTGLNVFTAAGLRRVEFTEDDYERSFMGARTSVHKVTLNITFKYTGID